MLPHMVGEFVVLLFLKLPVVERFRCFRQFTGKRFEQKVDKLRIVENADILKRNGIPKFQRGKFVYIPKKLLNEIFN